MNPWRPVDAVAGWIKDCLDYEAQLRLGVLMLLLGLALLGYMPFTNEQPLIYFMSAAALIFAGCGVIVGAEAAMEASDE